MSDVARPAIFYPEPRIGWLSGPRLRFLAALLLGTAVYAACWHVAQIEPVRLWEGLPRLAHWSARAFPPDFSEADLLLRRAAETVAMATLGTTLGVLLAAPLCLLAASNIAPSSFLYYPARWLLNVLRGIDSFVFALLFVAAVGLGPFAGVLGVGLHAAGSIAKLWAEAIEAVEPGPLDAAAMTGAGRSKIVVYALLPDVLPSLASIVLYVWEFNVRSSTVLGVVGAGGIGQELKNSVDLLMFPRVFAILLIILAMVTLIDQFSAWLRRRLV
jgi:phosphonate transport system permease protein